MRAERVAVARKRHACAHHVRQGADARFGCKCAEHQLKITDDVARLRKAQQKLAPVFRKDACFRTPGEDKHEIGKRMPCRANGLARREAERNCAAKRVCREACRSHCMALRPGKRKLLHRFHPLLKQYDICPIVCQATAVC